ncbi:hypothetical protein CsSME_00026740 [Camellia sinensis var. sinensis]
MPFLGSTYKPLSLKKAHTADPSKLFFSLSYSRRLIQHQICGSEIFISVFEIGLTSKKASNHPFPEKIYNQLALWKKKRTRKKPHYLQGLGLPPVHNLDWKVLFAPV